MNRPVITIHDGDNVEVSREMNDLEFADHKANLAAVLEAQAQAQAAATQKAALLARLGITADEAKLLIG